jgi:predicted DNA binding protein
MPGIDGPIDGSLMLVWPFPPGDLVYPQYGPVDVDPTETLEALTDQLPHSREVKIFERGTDTARFELRLSKPPVVSIIASSGGYLQRAIIEDDEYQLTIHLPVTVEPRRVIEAVNEAYPNAELRRRRQITRRPDQITRANQALVGDLTDRQRATLEAAYHSGFFEWPRDATGEEVADSLGVAPSTFSHHLRKGQQAVFEVLFSTTPPAE